MSIISTDNVTQVYNPDTVPVHAVNGITSTFEKGEFSAIVGPSGCGKTTFLNMLGGLERPTTGTVKIMDQDITRLSNRELADFRLHNIGFVFQAYNLIPVLSAYENVAFIMELLNFPAKEIKDRAMNLLEAMSIADKANTRPAEMSGGQQQRVAVARALASKPQFILADEPTANLDSHSTENLLQMMLDMNEKEGTTFIFSTHDDRVMKKAKRLVRLEDGKIIADEKQ